MAVQVLITGFAPFGGEKINPAWEAVEILPDQIEGANIVKAQLPVLFGRGAEVLAQLVAVHRPEITICVGQAGGRAAVGVERVAVNLRDAAMPDNSGNAPADEPIMADGPAAYFSNLPTRAMAEAIRAQGIPAVLSYSAGTYVCNDVMYHLLYWIDKRWPQMQGGFIHVPYDISQAAGKPSPPPSLPVPVIARALEAAIGAAVRARRAEAGVSV